MATARDMTPFVIPNDPYEWEFAGVRRAAGVTRFDGELGLLSVVTSNYDWIAINSVDTRAAFTRLSDLLNRFLDCILDMRP